ncbi:RNA-guided endonuclease InsQ/TnpB family protein [Streptomyces sp. NPDC058297]|uniref:RNA-guided endonuclease InsQ/TnpB family protein n=1 Tax=Streptomyces sp. NPDC058297 TaxID=3346433 RepID=UPI0036E03C30
MKLVVRVKLLPTPVQALALEETLQACNEAANWLSEQAHAAGATSRSALQASAYTELKARGLSAQPALHVVRKVADAYTALAARLNARRVSKRRSERSTEAAVGKPVVFRPGAAQPFDDRCLSWQTGKQTVSIWTIRGRMKNVVFTGAPDHLAFLAAHRKGESDLLHRNGSWYLVATCEVPEAKRNVAPDGFLGVDLGVVNIATVSTGVRHGGRRINRTRERDGKLRSKLQKKNTKSAKRRAKQRAGKETRRARDINHKISKCIVAEAQRTGRGIALEDLTGIRERVRLRKPQRARLHSWSFRQLGQFIAYKAKRAGVPLVYVDPAYTSQECSQCHHIDRRNRPSRAEFACRVCGLVEHADLNASQNIAARGWWAWVRGAESQVPALALSE